MEAPLKRLLLSPVSFSVSSQCLLSASVSPLSVSSQLQCLLSVSPVSFSVSSQCLLSASVSPLSFSVSSQCLLSASVSPLSFSVSSQCLLSASVSPLSVSSQLQCLLSASVSPLSVSSQLQCLLSASASPVSTVPLCLIRTHRAVLTSESPDNGPRAQTCRSPSSVFQRRHRFSCLNYMLYVNPSKEVLRLRLLLGMFHQNRNISRLLITSCGLSDSTTSSWVRADVLLWRRSAETSQQNI
ncbi:hypothetical protein NQZ68_042265 [Dissostichus eleginoides]|nr:hypothetical protein NQZ68_042265 [Dissostichus eleginoides]